jgi:hypothetical protein
MTVELEEREERRLVLEVGGVDFAVLVFGDCDFARCCAVTRPGIDSVERKMKTRGRVLFFTWASKTTEVVYERSDGTLSWGAMRLNIIEAIAGGKLRTIAVASLSKVLSITTKQLKP